jgi:uncharacterized membrane protein
VRIFPRAPLLLTTSLALTGLAPLWQGTTPPPVKKPPVGPAAPQSTHYPILLLAFGNDPSWSLRIGQKGPERLDRQGYPPITLDPAEVTHETAADSWTYHAKDSATGASVAAHINREPCSAGNSDTKYSFRAVVEHAQIGALIGCARIAAELFPKITNQSSDDEEDPKEKPAPPTITNFKPPTAIAFLNPNNQIVVKRGDVTRIVPGKPGHFFELSHDGKKLLFIRDEQVDIPHIINEYNLETSRTRELISVNASTPFWSPDDSRIVFFESVDSKWQIWTMPADAPESAAALFGGDLLTLYGWADARTVLADDKQNLYWIGDDGDIKQVLPISDLCGAGQFGLSSANRIRIHPQNPDLLLVSAALLSPAIGTPVDPRTGSGRGFFLYEIRAKRRVLLSPPNMFAQDAEWSRDGVQIFFTGSDSSHRPSIYRIFWDGSGLRHYRDGSGLVVGE